MSTPILPTQLIFCLFTVNTWRIYHTTNAIHGHHLLLLLLMGCVNNFFFFPHTKICMKILGSSQISRQICSLVSFSSFFFFLLIKFHTHSRKKKKKKKEEEAHTFPIYKKPCVIVDHNWRYRQQASNIITQKPNPIIVQTLLTQDTQMNNFYFDLINSH